jgi:hypothetical protein
MLCIYIMGAKRKTLRRKNASRKNVRRKTVRRNTVRRNQIRRNQIRRKTVRRNQVRRNRVRRKTVRRNQVRRNRVRRNQVRGGWKFSDIFSRVCGSGGCVERFDEMLDEFERDLDGAGYETRNYEPPPTPEPTRPEPPRPEPPRREPPQLDIYHDDYNRGTGRPSDPIDHFHTYSPEGVPSEIITDSISIFVDIISRIYLYYHCPSRDIFDPKGKCSLKCGHKKYAQCTQLCCTTPKGQLLGNCINRDTSTDNLEFIKSIALEVLKLLPGHGENRQNQDFETLLAESTNYLNQPQEHTLAWDTKLENNGFVLLAYLLRKIITTQHRIGRSVRFTPLQVLYNVNGNGLEVKNVNIPMDSNIETGIARLIVHLIWESLTKDRDGTTCWEKSEIYNFFAFFEMLRSQDQGKLHVGPMD